MPAPLIAKLARRNNLDSATVEGMRQDCKSGIKPGEGGKGWGLVVQCVRAKIRQAKKKK